MSLAEAYRPAAPRPSSPASLPAARPPLRLRRVPPRDDLAASVGDAAALAVMIGLGETYFAAFALALGTGETFAGLVATLPMLAGATLHLATPRFLARQKSYKKWVVACVSLQAASLLAMPLAALFRGSFAAVCIFAAATFYWAGSQASGPAWNTWVEELIPRRLRARFLAFRSRISQACTLAGFAFGGLALQAGKSNGWLVPAFVGIFLIGSACRFLSGWFLSRHSEPSRGRYYLRQVPMREVFLRSRKSGGGTPIVLYLLAMQAAVQISGPYFAPYMLAQRDMSYFSYMVLVGIGYLGKVIALPLWGKVAHQSGARRLLWIGGTSIVPIAALWLGGDSFSGWETSTVLQSGGVTIPLSLSAEFVYLGLIQLISGIVWAAYELAMLLMFFEAIPKQDRASVMTFYNFGNAAAHVVGGLIGAAVLQFGQESHTAYLVVFGMSSVFRLCTVPLLATVKSQPVRAPARASQTASVTLRETPEPV
jgi:MFS family permease